MKILGSLVAFVTLALAGCASTPELYCDETTPCTAGHPICDLEGVCPLSDGIRNTCIPEACWDAGPADVDATIADASQTDASLADAGLIDASLTDALPVADAVPPPCTNAIVFIEAASSAPFSDSALIRIDANGANRLQLAAADAFHADPDWQRNGTRIVFSKDFDIYAVEETGLGLVPLATGAALQAAPRWSPDSSKIAYVDFTGGDGEIFVMNANGSGKLQLTNNSVEDAALSWSPDGSRIAFVSILSSTNYEIYVVNVNGTGLQNLTNNAAKDGGDDEPPLWAPDGTKILFVSDRTGNPEIFAMNSNGTNPVNLTNSPSADRQPSLSGDGQWVAFARAGDIYKMTTSGVGQVKLTTSPTDQDSPIWSPDGAKISFESYEQSNPDVWVMDADGSDQVRLTNSNRNRHVSWKSCP